MLTADRRGAGEANQPGDANELEAAHRIPGDPSALDAKPARSEDERRPEVHHAVANGRPPLPPVGPRRAEGVRARDRAIEELGLQESQVVRAGARQDRDVLTWSDGAVDPGGGAGERGVARTA